MFSITPDDLESLNGFVYDLNDKLSGFCDQADKVTQVAFEIGGLEFTALISKSEVKRIELS